jgi:hypothetical protein
MKKAMSLLVLVLVISMLPLMAAAKQGPAIEVVGDSAAETAIPSSYPSGPVPEVLLYDNGPMITHPAGGFNGADASALQSALAMNTYGFGHQFTYLYRMADDFSITDPMGWDLDAIQFYAYQTGTYTYPPVSTMTAVYYQIWNGSPDNPNSTILCGDLATNQMTATSWSGIYRVLDTALTNAQRPIMEDTVAIWPSCAHLGPGTYWIEWMGNGNLASGPWANPITILGQTTTGNALQYTTAWAAALDTGTSTQQGIPFRIFGTVTQPSECWTHLFRTKLNWAYTARAGWVKTVFAGIVHNDAHVVIGGATVTGFWTQNGVAQPPVSFVTTPLGQFKFPWKGPWAAPGIYTFTVTNIQYDNCTYDPAANEAPNSRTVTIPPPPY